MEYFKTIGCSLLFLALVFCASVLHAQDENNEGNQSNEAIAKELANPNTTLGTMAFQLDYLSYQGDLPDASSQNGFTLNFQPSLPIPIGKGVNLFIRPNIPIYLSQPVFGANGFENVGFNLGNISADVAVGKTWPSKTITILGAFGSFRTATNDALRSNYTLLGPEIMVAQLFKWGAIGAMVNHAWSVNSLDADVDSFTVLADDMWAASATGQSASITAGQYFYVVNLKNAWQITGQPTWSYNHNAEEGNKLTFPIGTGVNKVTRFGKLPVKLSLQYWYYVASPDTFGPQHQIRLQIAPVVPLPW
ncbi:MAG: hypothetical protein WBM77_08950 [Maribacter sp.]